MGTLARCPRILYVEGHADTLDVMGKLLRREGHTVVTAGSCRAVQEAATGEPFDLLIPDVGFPDGDGLRLLAELQADYRVRGVAVSGRERRRGKRGLAPRGGRRRAAA
jgi:two-component system CheB/CheR fusion protein